MARKKTAGGSGRRSDDLPKEGSEDYISLQQRKKELRGQAVSGAIRKKDDPTSGLNDKPQTTVRGKGAGASAAIRKRLDKVKL